MTRKTAAHVERLCSRCKERPADRGQRWCTSCRIESSLRSEMRKAAAWQQIAHAVRVKLGKTARQLTPAQIADYVVTLVEGGTDNGRRRRSSK